MKTLRKAFAGAAVCATILAGTTWNILDAQTAKKDAPSQTAPAKRDRSRRVPSNFGKVGLTTEQRERIYKIQAKHHEKIDELQKQLDNARLEMMKECEGVLTAEQRRLLEQLRNKPAAPPAEPSKTAEKR